MEQKQKYENARLPLKKRSVEWNMLYLEKSFNEEI